VRDVDLRQPDQEPRLPATPLQHDQPMTTMDATAPSFTSGRVIGVPRG
jgi:hypothetical protein